MKVADEAYILGLLSDEIRSLSAKTVAGRMGISPQYLSDIRNGRRVMPELVAEYFGYRRVTIYIREETG